MDTAKIKLTLTIDYKLNGEKTETLEDQLLSAVNYLTMNGMLTGNTEAEVEKWKTSIKIMEKGEN
jgi:hypothetical protein